VPAGAPSRSARANPRYAARVLRTTAVRPLTQRDYPELRDLLRQHPVDNVFVASRVESLGVGSRLGADLWAYDDDGRLVAACYAGANLVPVEATPEIARVFADHLAGMGRRCSSLVGPADAVSAMWPILRDAWGPARDERLRQPVMAIDHPAPLPPDPLVRPVEPDELDVLLPASIAMFTEEVGVSPVADGGVSLYRARVLDLIRSRKALARIEDGTVIFKADIGAVSEDACQVQGVWVHPARRGQGLAAPAMAAVVEHALAEFAPIVSLYVNDYNQPARAAYRRAGFTEVGTFASVLF
jgi:predicted GNAT family acetyltransferase